jgi:hypothetical protein
MFLEVISFQNVPVRKSAGPPCFFHFMQHLQTQISLKILFWIKIYFFYRTCSLWSVVTGHYRTWTLPFGWEPSGKRQPPILHVTLQGSFSVNTWPMSLRFMAKICAVARRICLLRHHSASATVQHVCRLFMVKHTWFLYGHSLIWEPNLDCQNTDRYIAVSFCYLVFFCSFFFFALISPFRSFFCFCFIFYFIFENRSWFLCLFVSLFVCFFGSFFFSNNLHFFLFVFVWLFLILFGFLGLYLSYYFLLILLYLFCVYFHVSVFL